MVKSKKRDHLTMLLSENCVLRSPERSEPARIPATGTIIPSNARCRVPEHLHILEKYKLNIHVGMTDSSDREPTPRRPVGSLYEEQSDARCASQDTILPTVTSQATGR